MLLIQNQRFQILLFDIRNGKSHLYFSMAKREVSSSFEGFRRQVLCQVDARTRVIGGETRRVYLELVAGAMAELITSPS